MILERIETWARQQPARTALVHNGRALSYRRFADAIWATLDQLMSLAPPSQGVAAVLAADLLNAWLLTMAARAAGLTTVAVAALPDLEALAFRDLACVLVADTELGLVQNADHPPRTQLLVVPVQAGATAQARPIPRDGRPPLGGYIPYTSGVTGTYKKLYVDGRLDDERNQTRVRNAGYSPETVLHAFDFGLWTGIGFRSPSAVWLAGGSVVVDQTPDRYANFFRHGITYAPCLPETLRGLTAAHPERRASQDDSLLIWVGGGFTPLSLAEQTTARLSGNLVIGFSATEVIYPVMTSRFRSLDDLHWLTPLPSRHQVEVVDEDGAPAPAGVEGHLRVGLTELDSHAYLDDEAASARAFRDGFFYPGDLAVAREDGKIRVLGRAADVINIGGQKRAVGPIEETLRQALGADEVCAFAGLTASGEEELVLAVRSHRSPDKQEIKRLLGGSQIFQRVRVEVFPDFPRTRTGKTRRIELRRMLFRD